VSLGGGRVAWPESAAEMRAPIWVIVTLNPRATAKSPRRHSWRSREGDSVWQGQWRSRRGVTSGPSSDTGLGAAMIEMACRRAGKEEEGLDKSELGRSDGVRREVGTRRQETV